MIKNYLKTAAECYYAGSPIISDEVFDRLAESVGYAEVGAKQHENKGKHQFQLFSLAKYYEDEGIKPLEGYKTVPSLKLDGACISLLYVEGTLVQSLTRGDGIYGQDITAKVMLKKDFVPLNIPIKGIVQVSGEVVAPKILENSRNYAAGSLNLKSVAEFCERTLSFFAHGVQPYQTATYREDISILKNAGFNTVCSPSLEEIYECDGIVHRIDDNKIFEELGYTAKAPKGSYALKTRKEAVETELLGVEWSVGKSGRVSPIGILKPVYIGDKLVSRCTLNNPGYIEMLELYIGCTVAVIMGGEVIPKLVYKVE